MITEKYIEELINKELENSNLYLLNLRVSHKNDIVALIDGYSPVSIKDCVSLSRKIEGQLDRDVEDFSLQVSSPGITEPLHDWRQFKKNVGRQVEIKLPENKTISGTLVDATPEKFELKPLAKGKKKKSEANASTENLHFAYDEVEQTKIIIAFK